MKKRAKIPTASELPKAPEQAIPAEVLKGLYLDWLEMRSVRFEALNASREADRAEAAFQAKFTGAFRQRGLDPAHYNVNLKHGTVALIDIVKMEEKPAAPAAEEKKAADAR